MVDDEKEVIMLQTKILEALSLRNLTINYAIGNKTVTEVARNAEGKAIIINGEPKLVKKSIFVNELQEAIDAGELDILVQQSADVLHNGDTAPVIDAIIRNLDSYRTNLKKRSAYNPTKAVDEVRLRTMEQFTDTRRKSKKAATGSLPKWAYGKENIGAITDPKELQKVINSIADVCCDKAAGSYAKYLGEDYKEVAKENRKYARERLATLTAPAAPSEALIAKLDGKQVRLSQVEIEELKKLLKLN
jgi:hypothetical protein